MLPILILLLSLSGLGWLLSHTGTAAERAARNLKREAQTAHALAIARDALLGFAANYRNKEHPNADFGYLPCPDLDGDGSSETVARRTSPASAACPTEHSICPICAMVLANACGTQYPAISRTIRRPIS